MNTEGIKSHLTEYFKNGDVKFHSFIDVEQKQINSIITHPEVNAAKEVKINIFPKENEIQFELIADNTSICRINDTYDNALGTAFTQWFKPFLRSIVTDKYELEGDVIADELLGTDYCQVRAEGIIPFVNLTEMLEFTI